MNAQASAEGNKGFKANLVNEILELNRSIGSTEKGLNKRTGEPEGTQEKSRFLRDCRAALAMTSKAA